ncbi:hypothetical protein BCR32DRAFT_246197 [Anaeromyces robustus]|uniref:Uncharacterized protein n=1 Tax=Anaeromyces robustus TaxID=1754192 RepID=A0A1Y1X1L4_9FUNG|nr:hypothetical protein BCR32DRAFT_246197 [Anaeromyces robustus]|eukprot:ORX79689.1 hypothetical protein BCR32DRAFT_246197 [Anaeromyces robustus]
MEKKIVNALEYFMRKNQEKEVKTKKVEDLILIDIDYITKHKSYKPFEYKIKKEYIRYIEQNVNNLYDNVENKNVYFDELQLLFEKYIINLTNKKDNNNTNLKNQFINNNNGF